MINQKRLIIILPTYNEKDNLSEVIGKIYKLKIPLSVVIVDDNSPDGTGEIADKLSKKYPHLYVIHRKGKRGRGLAGKEGFLFALKKNTDLILEMDADLSHNPLEIPKLMTATKNYDLVLGSRYMKGGKVRRPLYREFSSFLGGNYLKLILGLPPSLTDPTSGFRLFRKEILKKIKVGTLESIGPPIISEVLIRCKDYRIGEVPITFIDRKKGKSKLTIKILLISLFLPLKWRFKQIFLR